MPYGEGPPSMKAKMRVQEAHSYAASKLDPIIGEAVSTTNEVRLKLGDKRPESMIQFAAILATTHPQPQARP